MSSAEMIPTATGAVSIHQHADGRIHLTVWCGIQENGCSTFLTADEANNIISALATMLPVRTAVMVSLPDGIIHP